MLNKEDILALAWEYSEGSGKRYTFTEENLFEFLKELKKETAPAQDEREAFEACDSMLMTGEICNQHKGHDGPCGPSEWLTRPAQKVNNVDTPEQQPLYQVRRYGEGWQDVDHIRYVACQDDLDYYTRELYAAPIAQIAAQETNKI